MGLEFEIVTKLFIENGRDRNFGFFCAVFMGTKRTKPDI